MMRILLVEDEAEKKRLITEMLVSKAGLSLDSIDFVSDVYSAKVALTKYRYELLILDINLPKRPELKAQSDAGLDVIRHIVKGKDAKAPKFIVGLTAYDASLETALSDYDSPLWRVLKFSHTNFEWWEHLLKVIVFLQKEDQPPYPNDGAQYHVDLGIVVALDAVELESVLAVLPGWEEFLVKYDHARYFRGVIECNDRERKLSVVVVPASRKGMPTAAVAASKLIHSFRPRYVAITGICAGVRSKTRIGDILVADPCFDWGSGKWIKSRATKKVSFHPAPYHWRLDAELREAVKRLAADPNSIGEIFSTAPKTRTSPKSVPAVLIDAVASGGSVLQASSLMRSVREQHKDLIGVDMENYAVFTAVEDCGNPKPKCIAIKSVCDFGDENKKDGWQRYAAHTSASFLLRLAKSGAFSKP